jgi:hypothetical protein
MGWSIPIDWGILYVMLPCDFTMTPTSVWCHQDNPEKASLNHSWLADFLGCAMSPIWTQYNIYKGASLGLFCAVRTCSYGAVYCELSNMFVRLILRCPNLFLLRCLFWAVKHVCHVYYALSEPVPTALFIRSCQTCVSCLFCAVRTCSYGAVYSELSNMFVMFIMHGPNLFLQRAFGSPFLAQTLNWTGTGSGQLAGVGWGTSPSGGGKDLDRCASQSQLTGTFCNVQCPHLKLLWHQHHGSNLSKMTLKKRASQSHLTDFLGAQCHKIFIVRHPNMFLWRCLLEQFKHVYSALSGHVLTALVSSNCILHCPYMFLQRCLFELFILRCLSTLVNWRWGCKLRTDVTQDANATNSNSSQHIKNQRYFFGLDQLDCWWTVIKHIYQLLKFVVTRFLCTGKYIR